MPYDKGAPQLRAIHHPRDAGIDIDLRTLIFNFQLSIFNYISQPAFYTPFFRTELYANLH